MEEISNQIELLNLSLENSTQEMSRLELFNNLKVIELCGNDCSLCDTTFDDILYATKCGHLFCLRCLNGALGAQRSRKPSTKVACPMCDASIQKSGQSRLRLKAKIKRLLRTSKREKEKFLKTLKMYRTLRVEGTRTKRLRTSSDTSHDK